MTTWQDIEDVMAYWFREGARIAWVDLVEIRKDHEDLCEMQRHVADMSFTFRPEERAILAEMHTALNDMLALVAEELRPQLRLAAAGGWAMKSLSR
jgi:hypothetical protein